MNGFLKGQGNITREERHWEGVMWGIGKVEDIVVEGSTMRKE